jgi:hypothetical protein
MTDTPTAAGTSPLQQIPPAETIRRRLAVLAQERSQLRQLLRIAVRRERVAQAAPGRADHGA